MWNNRAPIACSIMRTVRSNNIKKKEIRVWAELSPILHSWNICNLLCKSGCGKRTTRRREANLGLCFRINQRQLLTTGIEKYSISSFPDLLEIPSTGGQYNSSNTPSTARAQNLGLMAYWLMKHWLIFWKFLKSLQPSSLF